MALDGNETYTICQAIRLVSTDRERSVVKLVVASAVTDASGNTYATGGVAPTAASLGLRSVLCILSCGAVDTSDDAYVAKVDPTGLKMQLFTEAPWTGQIAELADTTAINDVTFHLAVIGVSK